MNFAVLPANAWVEIPESSYLAQIKPILDANYSGRPCGVLSGC